MRRFCRVDINHLVRSNDEHLMNAVQAWILPRIDQLKDAAMGHVRELVAAEMMRLLCAKLTARGDVSECSLELQVWWRDHQRADTARVLKETSESERQRLMAAGLAKLTDSEAAALGLEK